MGLKINITTPRQRETEPRGQAPEMAKPAGDGGIG
jgi:hypothetical protein